MLPVAPFHGHLRVGLRGALALAVIGHAGVRSAVQYSGGGAPVVKAVGGNFWLGSQAVFAGPVVGKTWCWCSREAGLPRVPAGYPPLSVGHW